MGPTWAICSFAASRAKLTMLNTVSKIRGQVKNPGYPQSEGLLGECMVRHGKELGGESNFGEGQLRGRGGGGGSHVQYSGLPWHMCHSGVGNPACDGLPSLQVMPCWTQVNP